MLGAWMFLGVLLVALLPLYFHCRRFAVGWSVFWYWLVVSAALWLSLFMLVLLSDFV